MTFILFRISVLCLSSSNIIKEPIVTVMFKKNSQEDDIYEKARAGDNLYSEIFFYRLLSALQIANNQSWVPYNIWFGDTFVKKTVKKVQNCDAFSVQINFSKGNKIGPLEIRANIASSRRVVERRHSKVVDLEYGSASMITKTVIEAFAEDKTDIDKAANN